MKSLKVLAIQGNRIERLPLCLGNMSSLRVLKVDGNPLVFPPAKICMMDEDEQAGVMGAGERALVPAAAITQRIKAYLREYGAPPNGNARTPRAIDSDGELRFVILFVMLSNRVASSSSSFDQNLLFLAKSLSICVPTLSKERRIRPMSFCPPPVASIGVPCHRSTVLDLTTPVATFNSITNVHPPARVTQKHHALSGPLERAFPCGPASVESTAW